MSNDPKGVAAQQTLEQFSRLQVEDVFKEQHKILLRVHGEQNPHSKIETLADFSNTMLLMLERINKESTNRDINMENKLDETREFFAAEFNGLNKRMDLLSRQMAEMRSGLSEEIRVASQEQREKLTALLKQRHQPS